MRLRLVTGGNRHAFDFSTADFDIPIPPDIAALALEDAATPETPIGLEDFRSRLSDWETDPTDDENYWCFALANMVPVTREKVVPLVTQHYVRDRLDHVFAQWQAARETRRRLTLVLQFGRLQGSSVPSYGAAVLVRLSPHGRNSR